MRLLSYRHAGIDAVGVRQGDRVIPLPTLISDAPSTLLALLQSERLGEVADAVAASTEPGLAVDAVKHCPLIPRPGKIVCIGRNYAAHAEELGNDAPTFPEVFMRAATTLLANGEAIVRPTCSDRLDFEGEFAFIIAKPCRHVTEKNALDYVAGYTLFNDATLRDYQRFATQWTVGKNFDATGPFGPELVTADELPPGLAGLTLTTQLNGEEVQRGAIDNLIFPVRALIRILSEAMTLEPGDVVVTGTPAGVGAGRTPPLFMKPDDVVEVSVEGLGVLTNPVVGE